MKSLFTLTRLHKSIDSNYTAAYQNNVIESLQKFSEIIVKFLAKYKKLLLIDNLAEVTEISELVLSPAGLETVFHTMEFLLSSLEALDAAISIVFSCIKSGEPQNKIWDLYKAHASPSLFIPLPLEFLTKNIPETPLFDLLLDVLSKPATGAAFRFDWFKQIAFLARLRLLSHSQIICVVSRLAELTGGGPILADDNIYEFFRIVFCDEIVLPKSINLQTINFLTHEPEKPSIEISRDFYTKLWNLIIAKIPFTEVGEDSDFTEVYNSVQRTLEHNFPGISKELDMEEFEKRFGGTDWESSDLENFSLDISSPESIQMAIDFVGTNLNIHKVDASISDLRFIVSATLSKLLLLADQITSEHSADLSELANAVSQCIAALLDTIEFCSPITDIAEISTILKLAFLLEDSSLSSSLVEFVILRLKSDNQLLVSFFELFSAQLHSRPSYFCLKYKISLFDSLPNIKPILETFLDSVMDLQVSSGLLAFLDRMFAGNILASERLGTFIDMVKDTTLIDFSNDDDFITFLNTVTDPSCNSFLKDQSEEFQALKIHEAQMATLRIFKLIIETPKLSSGYVTIHWILSRLLLNEELKPERRDSNQLDALNLKTSSPFDIDAGTSMCLEIISVFLHRGASAKDLKRAAIIASLLLDAIIKSVLDKKLVAQSIHTPSVCAALIIFIIRADNSRVPLDVAIKFISTVSLNAYRVSIPQLVYKAYKGNPEVRASLFPFFIESSFDMVDYGVLHDPDVFEGMPKSTADALISHVIMKTFPPRSVEKFRLTTIAFWMSRGLISSKMARRVLDKLAGLQTRSLVIRESISIYRTIYGNSEYASLRQLASNSLLVGVDHSCVSSRPFSLGILGGVADLIPSFTFPEADPFQKQNQRIFDSEVKRIKVESQLPEALNLASGIQVVLAAYSRCLTELAEFKLSFARKQVLFSSIAANLTQLNTIGGAMDILNEEFDLDLVDQFVRVSTVLMSNLQMDTLGPVVYIYQLSPDTIDALISVIVKFVRDSNVQSHLVFTLICCIKDGASTLTGILENVPAYTAWNRFLLTSSSFTLIFDAGPSAEAFAAFINGIIESTFSFKEPEIFAARDLSRDPIQQNFVHERFFAAMAELFIDFHLPLNIVLKILKHMNNNADRIEVLCPALVRFLFVITEPRAVDVSSLSFSRVVKAYGSDAVFSSKIHYELIVSSVVLFLAQRPDFISFSVITDFNSQPFALVQRLQDLTRENKIFKENPAVQLIWTMFQDKKDIARILKYLPHVNLPEPCLRQMMFCLSNYGTAQTFSETNVAILVIVDLLPESFSVSSFTNCKLAPSWFKFAKSLLNWFTKTFQEHPQILATTITSRQIEKLFDFAFWNLQFDDKETSVSEFMTSFVESMNFASGHLKYFVIKLLASPHSRVLFNTLRSLGNKFFVPFCSNLRYWVLENPTMAEELQKLASAIGADSELVFGEDEIMAVRQTAIEEMKILNKDQILHVENLPTTFKTLCFNYLRLRQVRETDLLFRFIEAIHAISKHFYPRKHCVELERLAHCIASSIIVIVDEFLLYKHSSIFLDIFKFLCKHSMPRYTNHVYIDVLQIIMPQIRSHSDIAGALDVITRNLVADSFMLPRMGLPQHFYNEKDLIDNFYISYFDALSDLGIAKGKTTISLDSLHILFLFIILQRSDGNDKQFMFWIANYSRIIDNNVITEEFSESLKLFCIARKNLCKELIPALIKPALVETFLTPSALSQSTKNNMISVFSILLKTDPEKFNAQAAGLPENLKDSFSSLISDIVLKGKRMLVTSIVEKCKLPKDTNFNALDYVGSSSCLTSILKIDLNLLEQPDFDAFFAALDRLTLRFETIISLPNLDKIIEICSTAFALKIKYNKMTPDLDGLSIALRSHNWPNCSAEVSKIITEHLATFTGFKLSRSDCVSFIRLLAINPKRDEILIKALHNPLIQAWAFEIFSTLIECPEFNDVPAVFQNIFSEIFVAFTHKDNALNSEDVLNLLNFGKTNNLFQKSQIIAIESILQDRN